MTVAHQTVVAKVLLSKVRRLHGMPARTVSQRGMRLQLRVLGWISVPPLYKLRPSLRAALETAPRPVTDAHLRRQAHPVCGIRHAWRLLPQGGLLLQCNRWCLRRGLVLPEQKQLREQLVRLDIRGHTHKRVVSSAGAAVPSITATSERPNISDRAFRAKFGGERVFHFVCH